MNKYFKVLFCGIKMLCFVPERFYFFQTIVTRDKAKYYIIFRCASAEGSRLFRKCALPNVLRINLEVLKRFVQKFKKGFL